MQISEKIFPIVQSAITLLLIAVSLSLIMLLNYDRLYGLAFPLFDK